MDEIVAPTFSHPSIPTGTVVIIFAVSTLESNASKP
jgi:hypothetical protein